MCRHLLPITAVVSLALAAVLACGYVGQVGVRVARWRPAGPPPLYREANVKAEDGRVVCYWTRATVAIPTLFPTSGWHAQWHADGRSRLDLRPAIWDADAQLLVSSPTESTYISAAPIWCFEVPLLVAPVAWLRSVGRRRRGRAGRQGFAVVEPSGNARRH